MTNHDRRTVLRWTICSAVPLPAYAQEAGPIRVLIGVPPGGTTDMMARLFSKEIGAELGTHLVPENRTGATGIIAAGLVSKAPPDGNTILMAASSHATVQFLYPSITYDPDKDLVPIGSVAATPYVFVVHPSLPVRTFAEWLQLMKANPGKYTYASSGNGNAQHLAMELIKRSEGLEIEHVPYRGSGALLPDVLSGRVPMLFENIAIIRPHIESGAMRPLAVSSMKPLKILPEVPTISDSGIPGFEVLGWFAFWAPAGTSSDKVGRMNTAINKILARPEIVNQLANVGAQPMGGTPQQLREWMESEQRKWGKLIMDLGIKAQ